MCILNLDSFLTSTKNKIASLKKKIVSFFEIFPCVKKRNRKDSNVTSFINPYYDPNYTGNTYWQLFQKSYAFSLDWNDYADKEAAINCEDFFYSMKYNKVYTTSQFIEDYRKGTGRARFLGVKEILDRSCESENNKFEIYIITLWILIS